MSPADLSNVDSSEALASGSWSADGVSTLQELAKERAEAMVAHLGLYGPLLAVLLERPGDDANATAHLLKTNALRRYANLRSAITRLGFEPWPQIADASVLGAVADRVCALWRVRNRIEDFAPMRGFSTAYEHCDRVILRHRSVSAAEPNSMGWMRVSNMLALGDLAELVLRHRFGQDATELFPAVSHQIALSAVRAAMRFTPLPAGEPHPVEQLHVLLAQGAALMARIWQEAVDAYGDGITASFGEGVVGDIMARWARSNATMIALAEADAARVLSSVPRAGAAALSAALAYSVRRPVAPTVQNMWAEYAPLPNHTATSAVNH